MHLTRFPRVHLAHLSPPLEKLDRLSKTPGGPEIWIKRDDCTGLSTGGTQAGLITGLKAINAGIPLLGIGVRAIQQLGRQTMLT